MAGRAIRVVASGRVLVVRCRFARGLQRLALVLVDVMAEMPNTRALLMLAIAGRSAPDELERQQREHEDDENAAHGR